MSTFPEVEGPVRDWLKAAPELADATGNGRYVYFAAPDTRERPATWLTVARVGGAPQDTEVPLDDALIAFHCYGRSKQLAADLAATLVGLLFAIKQPTPMGTVTALHAFVSAWTFEPDPVLETPCVVVNAAMLFRATT
jgi:hypothetical protein